MRAALTVINSVLASRDPLAKTQVDVCELVHRRYLQYALFLLLCKALSYENETHSIYSRDCPQANVLVLTPDSANRNKSAVEPPSKQPRLSCAEEPDIDAHVRRVGNTLIQFSHGNGVEIEIKTCVDTGSPLDIKGRVAKT